MADKKTPFKQIQGFFQEFINDFKSESKPKSKITGVFSDEDRVYLVEKFPDGTQFLIPSDDGLDFNSENKISSLDYEGEIEIFKPVDLEGWDHPAKDALYSRQDDFDHANLNILGEFQVEDKIFLIYDCSYITTGHQRLIGGAVLTSMSNPHDIDWRSETPLWDFFIADDDIKYETLGVGGTLFHGSFYIYYSAGNEIYSIKIKNPFEASKEELDIDISQITVKKHSANPILGPNEDNHWESWTTLNPAVVKHDGLIHMFYRAQSPDHKSVLGYAVSKDGINFERFNLPVFSLGPEFDLVINGKMPLYRNGASAGGWGGCEDPKATIIDDIVYVIYVAFNGTSEPRLGMSSIHIDDILNHRWDKWTDPVMLTPWSNVWGTGIKSGALFPEKVNDKFVLMFRYWPNIHIDFVEDLDFGDGKKYLQSRATIKVRPDSWDSLKISAGAPPIKTDEGWLLVYSGVGYRDRSNYKIGAMLLDLNDPSKVLYRSDAPLITPEEWYEHDWKPGIVYPCGAIDNDGELMIYYGGGDKYVCAATCEIDGLLHDLKNDIVEKDLLKSVYVHD